MNFVTKINYFITKNKILSQNCIISSQNGVFRHKTTESVTILSYFVTKNPHAVL